MAAVKSGGVVPISAFADKTHVTRLLDELPGGVPSPARAAAGVIVLMLIVLVAMMVTVPWVQTAAGTGQVVALDPRDRVQTINALVQGRVNRSFVQDGSVVKEGDPIVEIADVDPNFVERLKAEREALAGRLQAARIATSTAKIDYDRQKRLFDDGLSARKDFESAKIRYQEKLAVEAQARAALNKADIGVSRQSSQVVRAPQDGRILRINAGNTATIIQAGDSIATFAPEHVTRAVEVFVNGLDAPLVQEGLPTRVMFEGWPAVQFSGWPEAALGTFPAVVSTVDPVASTNGLFRVLVVETPEEPWPDDRYLRLGSQARAWVQLSKVKLGYEIWRRLNRFPPRPVSTEMSSLGTASPGPAVGPGNPVAP